MRVYLFVATPGYSRRADIRAFRHERQAPWSEGLEDAFRHFGGLPAELLPGNARALVERHDAGTREAVSNERFHAFARYWGVRPAACAPDRARTKGKDERGAGYVKKNAIAGRGFAAWAALEAHLAQWTREVADVRIHGATGEAPRVRFGRDERQKPRPPGGRPPSGQTRELARRAQNGGRIELDTGHSSVPWTLIGAGVSAVVHAGVARISHAGAEVARHDGRRGRRERAVMTARLRGIVAGDAVPATMPPPRADELLRPTHGYEQVAGGGW